jgi:membrane-associated phospholipid phosphatase
MSTVRDWFRGQRVPRPAESGLDLRLEEALVAGALALLIFLAWVNDTPVFEPLRNSGLTLLTLIVASPVLAVQLLRRSQHAAARMLRDWLPAIGVLGVYESLKHLHAHRVTEWLGIVPLDPVMLGVEQALFGQPVPVLLEQWGWTASWFINAMWLFYVLVYYAGPAALLVYAYFGLRDRQLFGRLRRGLVLGLLGGYVFYVLVPVAGPLYAIPERFGTAIDAWPLLERRAFDALRYQWDCFPSLHTAIPWLLTGLGWRCFGWRLRALCVAGAVGVTLSTVALRYHYGIDVLAGLAWAALVAQVVLRLEATRWPAASSGRAA